MEIETKSGFACEINEEALNDWEIVEKLVDAQGGDYSSMITVLRDIIGADGYQAAKDHVRKDNGRVPADKIQALFFEILTAAGEANQAKKKS
jgi:hypothetical protein